MAVTLAITLGAHKGQNLSGNVVVTNGGTATVTIQSLTATAGDGKAGHQVVALPIPAPSTAVSTPTNILFGAGVGPLPQTATSLKLPPGYPLAGSATFSVGFTFTNKPIVVSIQAFTSDGSNPIATASIT